MQNCFLKIFLFAQEFLIHFHKNFPSLKKFKWKKRAFYSQIQNKEPLSGALYKQTLRFMSIFPS